MGVTLIFKSKTRRRLGTGAKGVLIPPEGDELGIFVPSFGLLEQDEIDYIVGLEREKKNKRVTQPRKVSIERVRDNYEVEIKEV